MSWTSQAEALAETDEIGADIALMAGRCRATGLDPGSFAPIMGAAMALGARPWHVMTFPYRSDRELIGELWEFEVLLRGRQNDYIKLRSQVVNARAWAVVGYQNAENQDPPDTGGMEYWARVIADCDAALDVLGSLSTRLRAARGRLMQAPAALGEKYEAVYALLSRGRVMPHRGRFLTGEEAPC